MSEKSIRPTPGFPSEFIKRHGAKGLLSDLWYKLLMVRGIQPHNLPYLIREYVGRVVKGTDRQSAVQRMRMHSNAAQELSRPTMTAPVFLKGLTAIGGVHVKMQVTVTWPNGSTSTVETEMLLSGDMEDEIQHLLDQRANARDEGSPEVSDRRSTDHSWGRVKRPVHGQRLAEGPEGD